MKLGLFFSWLQNMGTESLWWSMIIIGVDLPAYASCCLLYFVIYLMVIFNLLIVM